MAKESQMKRNQAIERRAIKYTYLILGGNGFIGSHIVDSLSANSSVHVKVLDSFSRPAQFINRENITIIKGSAFEDGLLEKALTEVDYIVHCLGASNPYITDANPYADIETMRQSIYIFEKSAQAGIKKIAFISSGGAVYGKIAERKSASEEDMPMPVSPYGICKLATEHYLEYFKQKYSTDYVVFRLSNPYGPRQSFKREHGVIPSFLHSILEDKEITVFGDGTSSRDYIYVKDAAKIIAESLLKKNEHSIYNLGSGKQTTLNDIISNLESILGKKAKIEYTEAPATTLNKTNINVERIVNDMGVGIDTSFEVGLKKTIFSQQVYNNNINT